MKRKLIAVVLALSVSAALLGGCSGSSSKSSESGEEKTTKADSALDSLEGTGVAVGVCEDPVSLAPWVSNNSGRIGILPSVYQTLVQTESLGSEMTGVMMESWEQLDDVTYNMTIYDYIYDTAGNHLTAKDVEFSYMTAKEQGNLSKLNEIKSVTALDDTTVQFIFEQPLMAGQLETLWSEAFVVTQAAYEASEDGMATDPVGTTNYEMVDFIPGSSVTLSKTDTYWQTDESLTMQMYKANVDNIEFDIITDTSQMANALKTGAIDMSNTITATDLAAFEEGGDYADEYNVVKIESNNTYMLTYNCNEVSPMSNENLRKAIAYCIDVDQIVETIFGGDAFKTYAYGNHKYGDYVEAWEKEDYYEYDPDKAKEYLEKYEEETGQKASNLTIKLSIRENCRVNDADVMQLVQGYILALGMNAEINTQSVNNYMNYLSDPSAWDITMSSENAASSNYLIVWWENQMNPNYFDWDGTIGFVNDQKLTELINTAKTPDGHTDENMTALHEYMTDKCYNYGMCGFYEYVVAADYVDKVYVEFRTQILPGGCEYNWDAAE